MLGSQLTAHNSQLTTHGSQLIAHNYFCPGYLTRVW